MNTFLTKISEFFSKDILFASLLPGLLFLVGISSVLVWIVGPVNALVLYGEQSTNSALLIGFLSLLTLIVVSYVLHSVRDMMLAFWCGRSFWHRYVFFGLKEWHQNVFKKRYEASMLIGGWMRAMADFNKQFELPEPPGLPDIPASDRNALIETIEQLEIPPSSEQKRDIMSMMTDAYKKYNWTSMGVVSRKFDDWETRYRAADAREAVQLDVQYGSSYSIQPTELGNIVQAYNEYSYKRYRMEAEVFWPRLQKVMDKDYLEKVADQRISLDFAVTCAMLSLGLFLVSLAGPWLFTWYPLWIVFGLVSLVLTWLSYRLAVEAASTLGHLVRSSYDLYRLKLLTDLNLKWPKDTDEEKATWLTFSQSITYGYSDSGKLNLIEAK